MNLEHIKTGRDLALHIMGEKGVADLPPWALRDDFTAGCYALNQTHFYDSGYERSLRETLELARKLVEIHPGRFLQTDVSAQYDCGSPWDIWTKSPESYVAVVAGFWLEDDERVIDWSKPEKMDQARETISKLLHELKIKPESIIEELDAFACIEEDQENCQAVRDKLIALIDELK